MFMVVLRHRPRGPVFSPPAWLAFELFRRFFCISVESAFEVAGSSLFDHPFFFLERLLFCDRLFTSSRNLGCIIREGLSRQCK